MLASAGLSAFEGTTHMSVKRGEVARKHEYV